VKGLQTIRKWLEPKIEANIHSEWVSDHEISNTEPETKH
jgi:hypothetical protein